MRSGHLFPRSSAQPQSLNFATLSANHRAGLSALCTYDLFSNATMVANRIIRQVELRPMPISGRQHGADPERCRARWESKLQGTARNPTLNYRRQLPSGHGGA